MPRQVLCPKCHQKVPYEGNPHRPFCSERCRRLDLGAWASGDYVIPGKSNEVDDSNVSTEASQDSTAIPDKECL